MIRINKLSAENIDSASLLADSVFSDQKVLPSEAFKASLNLNLLPSLNKRSDSRSVSLQYWVAIDDKTDTVVGTTGLYENEDDQTEAVWLGWYCVDKNYRNQKIGSMLLDHTIDQAKKMNKQFLRLYTSTNPEEKTAQIIYEKRGFHIMKNKEREPDGDYEIFYRELSLLQKN